MKFILLTYLDEKAWLALSPAEQQKAMAECEPHVKRLLASGKMKDGAPLEETAKAKTVTLKNGKPFVTDGPYAETREQLGGYTLFEADDMEEAVKVAAGFFGPSDNAMKIHIEVRPVVHYEMPS